MHKRTIGWGGFLFTGLTCALSAQSPVEPTVNSGGGMYHLSAVQVDTPPDMDGLVLADPIWENVIPVTGFVQSTPNEGESASEKTEVRVVFTEDTVYFGVVCYDSAPSSIIVRDSRRDSSMNEADSFQLVLDTFSDQQNGFVFGTTPAGQEYDGQVINEG